LTFILEVFALNSQGSRPVIFGIKKESLLARNFWAGNNLAQFNEATKKQSVFSAMIK